MVMVRIYNSLFKPNTFYAKIIAVLRETSDVRNTSTMILEVSGGTHDGSTGSMYDIALGPQTIMGATNSYPWSPTVSVGTTGNSTYNQQRRIMDATTHMI